MAGRAERGTAAGRRRRRRGERRPRDGTGPRPAAWAQEHARAALASLGRMWRSPLASAMTVAVIAVALALPGALWVLLKNAQRASAGWDTGADVSVYLEPGLAAEDAEQAAQRIARTDGLRVVQRLSADDALAEFRRLSGFDDALAALERNPLPAVVVVEPEPGAPRSAPALSHLAERLRRIEGVDRVQVDLAWVERLYALLDLVRRGAILFAAVLAAGVLLIVGNTIRLDILNRRQEIEVTKLIGASDAFVRRPFVYGGLWYGLLGAAGAWLLLAVARAILAGPAGRLAAAYGSAFRLEGLSAAGSVALLAAGAALGLLGSWLAVGRHLRRIEPG